MLQPNNVLLDGVYVVLIVAGIILLIVSLRFFWNALVYLGHIVMQGLVVVLLFVYIVPGLSCPSSSSEPRQTFASPPPFPLPSTPPYLSTSGYVKELLHDSLLMFFDQPRSLFDVIFHEGARSNAKYAQQQQQQQHADRTGAGDGATLKDEL
jgi:hypothetical protein